MFPFSFDLPKTSLATIIIVAPPCVIPFSIWSEIACRVLNVMGIYVCILYVSTVDFIEYTPAQHIQYFIRDPFVCVGIL